MINRIIASGWKGGRIDQELKPVNVLVGPNASGKTSIMDAVRLGLYGEVPGLGKQNQAVMRGACENRLSVQLVCDDGVRSVNLERKGDSVKKTVSGEQVDPEVPVSVDDLRKLSAEQLRSLMSIGGSEVSAEEFIQDIGKLCENNEAIHRCIATGKGDLDLVAQWTSNIQGQMRAEESNVRDSKAALAMAQKTIASMNPVPAKVVSQWEVDRARLIGEREELTKKYNAVERDRVRLVNAKRDLVAAQDRLAVAQESANRTDASYREIKNAYRENWRDEDAETHLKKAAELRAELESFTQSVTACQNASKTLFAIVSKLDEMLEKLTLTDYQTGLIKDAQEKIDQLALDLPGNLDSDQAEPDNLTARIEECERRAADILAPRKAYEILLHSKGFSSLEHAEEKLKSCKLEAANAARDVEEKTKAVSELSESEAIDKSQIDALEQQIQDLARKLSDAREYEDAVANEAKMQANIGKLEADLADMKAVAKAAIQVQASYLAKPIVDIQPDLDKFCDAIEIDRISAKFEKQGRSLTLAIYSQKEGASVPIETLSGGERLMVGVAFLYALNKARKPSMPMIFVESAELDQQNAEKMLKGLELASEEGIQCFMTSFVPVGGEGVVIGAEEVATA